MDSSYNDRKELVAQTGTPKINHTELLKTMGRGAVRKRWISLSTLRTYFVPLGFNKPGVSLANTYPCFFFLLK